MAFTIRRRLGLGYGTVGIGMLTYISHSDDWPYGEHADIRRLYERRGCHRYVWEMCVERIEDLAPSPVVVATAAAAILCYIDDIMKNTKWRIHY